MMAVKTDELDITEIETDWDSSGTVLPVQVCADSRIAVPSITSEKNVKQMQITSFMYYYGIHYYPGKAKTLCRTKAGRPVRKVTAFRQLACLVAIRLLQIDDVQ